MIFSQSTTVKNYSKYYNTVKIPTYGQKLMAMRLESWTTSRHPLQI